MMVVLYVPVSILNYDTAMYYHYRYHYTPINKYIIAVFYLPPPAVIV